MSEYKVQFEVFEGPLDLLLYLVKKEEVDIYEVNLTRIATQFIEYIEVMRELDLDIAGEFLVMASTLMYIKSRELLPKDQQAVVEEEDEGDDPRWELIRMKHLRVVQSEAFSEIEISLAPPRSEPPHEQNDAEGRATLSSARREEPNAGESTEPPAPPDATLGQTEQPSTLEDEKRL